MKDNKDYLSVVGLKEENTIIKSYEPLKTSKVEFTSTTQDKDIKVTITC